MRRSRGFLLVYAAAWLPYAVFYVAIAIAFSSASLGAKVTAATLVVIAAAVLGLGVLAFCDAMPWTGRRPARFALAHSGSAVLFTGLWAIATFLVFAVEQAVATHVWDPWLVLGPWLYWQLLIGLLVYGVVASVGYVVQVSGKLQEEHLRAEKAEALRLQAELKTLRASFDPHFIFNTLHSLMALVRHDPKAAETALERLSDMLRHVLRTGSAQGDEADEVTVREEWAFVQNYLELERLRLGDRLTVDALIDPEALACSIPVFTLQALVENAVKHAVAPRAGATTVRISACVDRADLVLGVRDDGPGTTVESVESSPGFGLQAIRQRLELRYADRARLDVDTVPGEGFASTVRIPVDEVA